VAFDWTLVTTEYGQEDAKAQWAVMGENVLTGNRWEMARDMTKAEAHDYRRGCIRLESDYKVEYRVELQS
jgi:hypothetical protein